MQKLEIVSMIKVDGTWIRQEDILPEDFRKLLEMKMDESMKSIGFERKKTA